jgi:threonine dehydrogenase-like Zn-dependent dehydrogenase
MKAIQLVAPGKPQIVEVAVPGIGDNEVLVKVESCVTCPHWDMTLFKGVDIFNRPGYPKYPIPWGYPGHEMAGVVVKAGRGVKALREGDRVATLETAGEDKPGFYCEYINRPENKVVKIPDAVSFDAAASMEMARSVSPNARRLGDVRGRRVGVVGMGPAGLIAVQMVRAMGAAEIVAMDVQADRLALAARAGATETLNPADPGDLAKLQRKRLKACMDCSGHASGLQVALDHTDGMVSVFGVIHGEAKLTTSHWLSGLSLVTALPMTDEDTQLVIRLWEEQKLDTGMLVGARLPFERYAEAVQLLMDRKALKVSLYPG